MNVTDASRVLGLRADILARNDALRGAGAREAGALKGTGNETGRPDFAEALASVSRIQQQAGDVSESFERGDMTDIAQVMIARQKASVAFEATLQVRNKLLGAYRDIMNMGA